MNFNVVRQANGENVTISAIADRIDGTSFISSGTPKQNCKFTDANGEQQSITIWQGNGQPIPEDKVGQTLSINISCKTKGNRTNYGGFWNATAQVAQLSSQPASQGAQKATETAKASSGDRNTSIERQCAWKSACAFCAATGSLVEDISSIAQIGIYFIETGEDLNAPDPVDDMPITNASGTEDIPF